LLYLNINIQEEKAITAMRTKQEDDWTAQAY